MTANPPPEIYFYHLMDMSFARVLSQLLPRALDNDWRVLVCDCDNERLDALDKQLWLTPKTGFLPHARARGDAQDALQPVLLSDKIANAGYEAQCLMMIGLEQCDIAQLGGFKRVCIFFDGLDTAMLASARNHWRDLKEKGFLPVYWQYEQGAWRQKHTASAS